MAESIKISILLNSNRIENIKLFFSEYKRLANDINNFEIIIHFDTGDTEIKDYLDDIIKEKYLNIKYLDSLHGTYFEGHIASNYSIPFISNSSQLIACYGDRILPQTEDWDLKLIEKINIYNDGIYRLCYSEYNIRSYSDIWEAGFAPSNIFFLSKKWLSLSGDLSPCFSLDSFIQCVSFYLTKHDNFNSKQINRDIVCNDIEFSGYTPEEKSNEKERERVKGQIKHWNILMSGKYQQEAKRRAMVLASNIMKEEAIKKQPNEDVIIIHNESAKKYVVTSSNREIHYSYPYRVNNFLLYIKKLYRKFYFLNYTGGGFYANKKSMMFNITYYLSRKYNFLKNLNDIYNHYAGKFK